VEEQLDRLFGPDVDALLELRTGYPPAVLASYAQVHGVSLLVVGIGRPSVLDRLRGDESTLRLARMTRTPLYAVAPGCAVLPRQIVVATDFSAASMSAAQLALAVSAHDADVWVVHVVAPSRSIVPHGALRRFTEALQTGFCGHVRAVELSGDPATEVLSFANAHRADAIALGAVGERGFPHGAIGSVATRVVRCSSCSLLLAPDLSH